MEKQTYILKPKTFWWLSRSNYFKYMLRELSCVFVGAYSIFLFLALVTLTKGQLAYENFIATFKSPYSIAFHLLTLLVVSYHSITWFALAPKAMPLYIKENKVPNLIIVLAHYIAWFICSGFIWWIIRGI